MAQNVFSLPTVNPSIGAPYIYKPGVLEGINPFSASSIGASLYERQLESTIRPMFQARSDAARQKAINSSISALAPAAAASGSSSPGAVASQYGPFTALSLTKDPALEQSINSVLGRIQSGNLSTLIREPKSTQLSGEITDAFNRFRGNVNDSNQSLEDFTKEFLALRPSDQAALQQESNVVGNYFGGPEDPNSLIAHLNQISSDRARAVSENTGRGLATIERGANIGNLARSAAGRGAGNSFVAGQIANATNALLADEARQKAEMERANLLDVTGIQSQNLGQRGNLLAAYLNRGLIPLQLQQQLTAADIANLSNLGQVDLANTLTERSGDQIARELGLLGGVRQLAASNRFEGLQKEVSNPSTGYIPAFDPGNIFNYGGEPLTLDMATGQPAEGPTPSLVPNLLSTSGASSAPVNPFTLYNQLTPQQLAILGAQTQSGGIDYGAGSYASNLNLPGTTIRTSSGEYIRDPITGQLQPVGADRLTDLQRLYE